MATFLSKLFKPKWQHKNAAIRLEAIKDLDEHNEDDQIVLLFLAQNDDKQTVRAHAIEKLNDAQQLTSLHQKSEDINTQSVIEKKMFKLANAQSLSIFDLITDNNLLTDIIIKSKEADIFISGLARIDDPKALYKIALASKTSKIRQAAAELIDSEEQLIALSNAAKTKDKSVFQITKAKLSKFKAQAHELELNKQTIEKILDDIEQLAKTEVLQHFELKLGHFKIRWDQIFTASDPAQQTRFLNALTLCEERINQSLKEQQLTEEKEQLIQTGGDEQEATLYTLSETLKRFRLEAATTRDLSALDALIKTQENRWLEATRKLKVDKSKANHYQLMMSEMRLYFKSLNTMNELTSDAETFIKEINHASAKKAAQFEQQTKNLKRILTRINWPKDYALPPLLTQCNDALGYSAEIKQKFAESSQEIQQKITGLIEKLDNALEDRQLKLSGKIYKDIQHKLAMIGAKQSALFHNQLSLRVNQLNELRDWQGFASNPRQIALCEIMEHLVSTHIEPREKADKIKEIQKEWKSLGGSTDQTLWQRFKTAADAAYAPCHAFFDEQNLLKKNNSARREKLISELDEFVQNNNWEHPDWRAAEKINRQARLEWKEAFPVDFKANKALQPKFNKLLDQFDEKLNSERNRNLALKTKIVDDAKALITLDELDQAMQQAKTLQQNWQKIGITPHKKERALWSEFRESCDQIFARRDQAKNEKKQELASAINASNTFCDELETFTGSLSNQSLAELKTALADYRKQYKQLPFIPVKALEIQQNRFEASLKLIKLSIASQENQQRLLEWKEIQRKSSLCRQIFSEESTAEASQLENDFNSQVALSKQLEIALKELWISVKAGAVKSSSIVSEDQARSLCIACEVAAGLESPETDKELRMQLQVSRLSKGMSSSAGTEHHTRESQLSSSLTEWYTKVGLNQITFTSLETRIEKTIQHLLVS